MSANTVPAKVDTAAAHIEDGAEINQDQAAENEETPLAASLQGVTVADWAAPVPVSPAAAAAATKSEMLAAIAYMEQQVSLHEPAQAAIGRVHTVVDGITKLGDVLGAVPVWGGLAKSVCGGIASLIKLAYGVAICQEQCLCLANRIYLLHCASLRLSAKSAAGAQRDDAMQHFLKQIAELAAESKELMTEYGPKSADEEGPEAGCTSLFASFLKRVFTQICDSGDRDKFDEIHQRIDRVMSDGTLYVATLSASAAAADGGGGSGTERGVPSLDAELMAGMWDKSDADVRSQVKKAIAEGSAEVKAKLAEFADRFAHVADRVAQVGDKVDVLHATATRFATLLTHKDYAACNWTGDASKLVIHRDKLLGEGGGGQVFEADYCGEPFAAKRVFIPAGGNAERAARAVLRECKYLERTKHTSVVRSYGVAVIGNETFLIQERCVCSLDEFYLALRGALSFAERLNICWLLAKAYAHMHSLGVVFSDIKAKNVLVSAVGKPVVCDFGSVTNSGGSSTTTTTSGVGGGGGLSRGVTDKYLAPEVRQERVTTFKSDVFAFGCMLYEVCSGKMFFPGMTDKRLDEAVADDRLREIIASCLAAEPKHRKTMSMVETQLAGMCAQCRVDDAAARGKMIEFKHLKEHGYRAGVGGAAQAPVLTAFQTKYPDWMTALELGDDVKEKLIKNEVTDLATFALFTDEEVQDLDLPVGARKKLKMAAANATTASTTASTTTQPASPNAAAGGGVFASGAIPDWITGLGVDPELEKIIASLRLSGEAGIDGVTAKELGDTQLPLGLRRRFIEFAAPRKIARFSAQRDRLRPGLTNATVQRDQLRARLNEADVALRAAAAAKPKAQAAVARCSAESEKAEGARAQIAAELVALSASIKAADKSKADAIAAAVADVAALESARAAQVTASQRADEAAAAALKAGALVDAIARDKWEVDDSVTACKVCQSVFSFFKRRHHCRVCGKIFCDDCSKLQLALPSATAYEPVQRSCRPCYDTAQRISAVHGVARAASDNAKAVAATLANLERSAAQRVTTRDRAIAEHASLSLKPGALAKSIAAADASIAAAKNALADATKQVAAIATDVTKLTAELDALAAPLREQQVEVDALADALAAAEYDVAFASVDADVGVTPQHLILLSQRAQSSNQDLIVRGAMCSALRLGLDAVALDATAGAAWACVADAMALSPDAPNGKAIVDGAEYTKRQCSIKALDLSKSISTAWLNLGLVTPMAGSDATVSVRGKMYSKPQLFIAALECDPANARALTAMAGLLTPADCVTIRDANASGGERTYTKIEMLVAALAADPQLGQAWAGVGAMLATTGGASLGKASVHVNGTECTAPVCFANALRCDPTGPASSAAWCNAGANLAGADTVAIAGRAYTRRECFLVAVRLDGTNALAWAHLGADLALGERVDIGGGITADKWHCLGEAGRLGPSVAAVWFLVGRELSPDTMPTLSVAGVPYTKKQAYEKCIDCDVAGATKQAWNNLGLCLGAMESAYIAGKSVSKLSCAVRSLAIDPNFCPGYLALSALLGATQTADVLDAATGKTRTIGQKTCVTEALRCDPRSAAAWENAAHFLAGQGAKATIATATQKACTRMMCLQQLLALEPGNALAWCDASELLATNGLLIVGSRTLTRTNCLVEACQGASRSGGLARAWLLLAAQLGATATASVAVNGRAMSAVQCALSAVNLDRDNSDTWMQMAFVMTPTEEVSVGGKNFTRRQSLVESVRLRPENARVWCAIGNTLTITQHTLVNGTSSTSLACFQQSLKLDCASVASAAAWHGIGNVLTAEQYFARNGRVYRRGDCLAEAQRLDPSGAYKNRLG